MLITIADVLAPDALARIRDMLARARWSDGRETAGAAAAVVKANRQADPDDPLTRAAATEVETALRANAMFMAAALPLRLTRPSLSRRSAPASSRGRSARR